MECRRAIQPMLQAYGFAWLLPLLSGTYMAGRLALEFLRSRQVRFPRALFRVGLVTPFFLCVPYGIKVVYAKSGFTRLKIRVYPRQWDRWNR